MRVFVTGGTGFIGGHVVSKLRARGDDVIALVRNPARAARLRDLGCELHEGDLSDRSRLAAGMEGADAVIHGAAIYEVGIPRSRRPDLHAANVEGTENALGAALDARTPRVVYISTVAAIGNTGGEVADETYEHRRDYRSYYEETKHRAHLIARRLIDEEGLPCVIVQPGAVYGPKDHSEIGTLMKQFMAGRMPAIAFPDLGLNLVHVEDVADGVLLALDKGRVGEQYILGGDITTQRGMIEELARITGKRPPRFALPTPLIKASAPLGRVIGPMMGFPPNLAELIRASDGVTYWATHEKAERELGYAPRSLEAGLRDTIQEVR